MGSFETFHSTSINAIAAAAPMDSIAIVNGDAHAKYDPPPEIGISTKMMAMEPVARPQ